MKSQKAKEGNLPGGIAGPGDSERFSDMMRVDQADQQDDDKDKDDNGDTQNILQPGTKISINDFQLLTVVGRGSFGKVYLCRHKATGMPYAMKILKKDQLVKKNLLIKTQGKYFCKQTNTPPI